MLKRACFERHFTTKGAERYRDWGFQSAAKSFQQHGGQLSLRISHGRRYHGHHPVAIGLVTMVFASHQESIINAKCEQGVIHQCRAFDINFFSAYLPSLSYCSAASGIGMRLGRRLHRTIAHRTEGDNR